MIARLSSHSASGAPARLSSKARLWVDIDDLVDYLAHHVRPSGIQRVVYEISRALDAVGADRVGFVVHGAGPQDLRLLDWSVVDELFTQTMVREVAPEVADESDRVPPESNASGPIRERLMGSLDSQDQESSLLRLQGKVVADVARLPLLMGRYCVEKLRARRARRISKLRSGLTVQKDAGEGAPNNVPAVVATLREMLPTGAKLSAVARPGDLFLTLGAPWHNPQYVHTVRWLRDGLRLSFGLLMYDLVPVRHPEWCELGMVNHYTAWHEAVLPLVDCIFAISEATAADVGKYIAQRDMDPSVEICAVKLGTNFSLPVVQECPKPIVDGPYVLFVSTLEARKNHALLFRVWRRLVTELPSAAVPTLVFAGREGWLVSDLMRQLENTDWLGGKIRFVSSPTDATLQRLYADCLFTVFPSFFEGWGLPVTESLGMGKPCVASNTTSIPEAGGQLVRYFNPYDVQDAYRVIHGVISDPAELASWTRRVRAEFRRISWEESATTILELLDPA